MPSKKMIIIVLILLVAAAWSCACVYVYLHRRSREGFEDGAAAGINDAGSALLRRSSWLCSPAGVPMKASGLLKSQTQNSVAKTICMLGSRSAPALLQAGGCSKKNDALFDPAFSDLVEDIRVQEGTDGIANCAVLLNVPSEPGVKRAGAASIGKAKSYDGFLRVRAIQISAIYQNMLELYKDMESKYEAKKAEYEKLLRDTQTKQEAYNGLYADYILWTKAVQECGSEEVKQKRELERLKQEVEGCKRELKACLDQAMRLQAETFVDGPAPSTKTSELISRERVLQGDANEVGSYMRNAPEVDVHQLNSMKPSHSPSSAAKRPSSSMGTRTREEQGAGAPAWWTLPQPIMASSSMAASVEENKLNRPANLTSSYGGFVSEEDSAPQLTDRMVDNLDDETEAMVKLHDVGCVIGDYTMHASGLVRAGAQLSTHLNTDERFLKCLFPAGTTSDLLAAPGGCSKENNSLYADEYASLIDDIATEGDFEGVPTCVVTFKTGNPLASDDSVTSAQAAGDSAKQYDNFVREQVILASEEYKAIRREYLQMKAKYEAMVTTYDEAMVQYQEMVRKFDALVAQRDELVLAQAACMKRVQESLAAQALIRNDPEFRKCGNYIQQCRALIEQLKARPKRQPPPPPPEDTKIYIYEGDCGKNNNTTGNHIVALDKKIRSVWQGAHLRGYQGFKNSDKYEDQIDGIYVPPKRTVGLFVDSDMRSNSKNRGLGPGFHCIKNTNLNNSISAFQIF
jgi:hypothetical protein